MLYFRKNMSFLRLLYRIVAIVGGVLGLVLVLSGVFVFLNALFNDAWPLFLLAVSSGALGGYLAYIGYLMLWRRHPGAIRNMAQLLAFVAYGVVKFLVQPAFDLLSSADMSSRGVHYISVFLDLAVLLVVISFYRWIKQCLLIYSQTGSKEE